MTYVRPHTRRDGTPVKGHYRRQRPRTAKTRTAPRRTAPYGTAVPRPRLVHNGPTTYVRTYYRADGTRVRGHRRAISPRTVAVVAGAGGGLILLILLLLTLASGPGDSSKTPTRTTPSQSSASAPSHR